jgi:hypothetical protein
LGLHLHHCLSVCSLTWRYSAHIGNVRKTGTYWKIRLKGGNYGFTSANSVAFLFCFQALVEWCPYVPLAAYIL